MDLNERVKEDIAKFNWADAAIAQLKQQKGGLTIQDLSDEAGYQQVRRARLDMVKYRGDIEKTRVALKSDALEYGKRVDAEAKRLTALITEIELPLKEKEDFYVNEKKRIAEEERLAEEKKRWEEANAKRLEEQRVEAERLAKEQAELKAAREKFEAEKLALQQQQAQQPKPAPVEDDLSWLTSEAQTQVIAPPAPLPVAGAASPLRQLHFPDKAWDAVEKMNADRDIEAKIKYGCIAMVKVSDVEMDMLLKEHSFRFDSEDDRVYDCDFGDVESIIDNHGEDFGQHLLCILKAIKPCDAVQFWVAR